MSETDDSSDLLLPSSTERRKNITSDNDIDLILAGRVSKSTISIPSVGRNQDKRARIVVLRKKSKSKDDEIEQATDQEKIGRSEFLHLLGEANGKQYDCCSRPDIEIHSIFFSELLYNEIICGVRYVSFIFDPTKQLFVLSDQIESIILKCMHHQISSNQSYIHLLALSTAVVCFRLETVNGNDDIRLSIPAYYLSLIFDSSSGSDSKSTLATNIAGILRTFDCELRSNGR